MLRYILPLILGLALASGGARGETVVRLMANPSPPYADKKLPDQGLALELVTHILSRTDYTPEITIENWSRAMEGVRIGLYDALATAWYSEERSRDFLFSDPYLSSELILVKLRSDKARYRSLQDLAGKRLGVRSDYAYGVDFSSVPDLALVEEHQLIQSLLNLLNGSVDLVIGDRRTLTHQLNEYLESQIGEFQVVPVELPRRHRHLAAGRNVAGHEAMVAAFNRALAESRKDGSHDAIVQKWDTKYAVLD